jgi:hypothetical protein
MHGRESKPFWFQVASDEIAEVPVVVNNEKTRFCWLGGCQDQISLGQKRLEFILPPTLYQANHERQNIQILTLRRAFLTAPGLYARNNEGVEESMRREVIFNWRLTTWWIAFAVIRLVVLIG